MENKTELIIITINTMLIPGIYWIGSEKILHEEKWKGITNGTTIGLAFIGFILTFISGWDRLQLAISISFLFPIYHIWFYRTLRMLFIKRNKREPKDVAFNFNSGLFEDRVFAIFFVLFSIFSSAAIFGPLIFNYRNYP